MVVILIQTGFSSSKHLLFKDEDHLKRCFRQETVFGFGGFYWKKFTINEALELDITPKEKDIIASWGSFGEKDVVCFNEGSGSVWRKFSENKVQEVDIAIRFYTVGSLHYYYFGKHSDIFLVSGDSRYKKEFKYLLELFNKIVRNAYCAVKLDKYIDQKFKILGLYGFEGFEAKGTYSEISKQISDSVSPDKAFPLFVATALISANEREFELIGQNKVRKKVAGTTDGECSLLSG